MDEQEGAPPNPRPDPGDGSGADAGSREHLAKRGVWSFKPNRGGLRTSKSLLCPICQHDSNCDLSAAVAAEPAWELDGRPKPRRMVRAVRCRRMIDAASGGAAKARVSRDGVEYVAGSIQAGGRVWSPVVDGQVVRPPPKSPEELEAERVEDEECAEAKRQLAEDWFLRSCGGSLSQSQGVDDPMVRAYFKGRGIDPAWFPGGVVPRLLRFSPDYPIFFDFDGRRGSKNPLRRAVKWNAQGECIESVPRAYADVPTPEAWQRGPCMIAAALSRRVPGKALRGVHVTHLVGTPDAGVAKNTEKVEGGRRWQGSCDGPIVLPAASATKDDPFPGGVLIAGEGIETTASVQVALACEYTAWAMKSSDGLVHVAEELEAIGSASTLHTLVLPVDLDKLVNSKGKLNRTGQRKALRVIEECRQRCPWITVVPRWVRGEDFLDLVKLTRLEGKDLELAEAGELGVAAERVGSEWWEHQPRGESGVDWNDPLRGGDARVKMAAALRRGWDPEAHKAAAESWARSEFAEAWANRRNVGDTGPGANGTRSPAEQAFEPGAGGGGNRGGRGGGGGGVGQASDTDPDDGRPENDGTSAFWQHPRWGGYTWTHPDDTKKRRIISPRGLDRARLFLLQKCRKEGDRRFHLAFWGGVWFKYKDGFWYRALETQIRGMIAPWLGEFWHRQVLESGVVRWKRIDPSERLVTEVMEKLKQECFIDSERMPAWLPAQIDESGEPLFGESVNTWSIDRDAIDPRGEATDYIVDRAGMIRLSWLVDLRKGKRTILQRLPHTPELFTAANRPYELPLDELAVACALGWDEAMHNELCPTFMRWLADAVADTPGEAGLARKRQLGQMLGDSISGNREDEKIYMLPGPRRSGKGVLLSAIIVSHGKGSVAATTLTKLGTPFGLYPLVGASAAVLSDAHIGQFADATQAVENLKAMRGNDLVQVEGKNLHPVMMYLNPRFWVFCNDEPDKLQDNSGALAGSMVMWPMTQSFYGSEDASIKRNVKREGAGIAVFALCHYAEVAAMDRPMIALTPVARDYADDFEDTSSHLSAFAKECLMMDPDRQGRQCLKNVPGREVVHDTLYNVYVHWCVRNERRHVGRNKLISRLRPLVNGGLKKPSQPVGDDGSRRRVVLGIDLNEFVPLEWQKPYVAPARETAVIEDKRASGTIPFNRPAD